MRRKSARSGQTAVRIYIALHNLRRRSVRLPLLGLTRYDGWCPTW